MAPIRGLQSLSMAQHLCLVSVVVRDYDEAIAFYVGKLGFTLVEDAPVPAQDKRWVVVAPPGARESRLLLARASTAEQQARIGHQTGGRVFLFLETDDFARDFAEARAGSNKPARMAIIAITTSNSMRVKPREGCRPDAGKDFMGQARRGAE